MFSASHWISHDVCEENCFRLATRRSQVRTAAWKQPPQEDFKSPPCLKTMLCPPSFRPLPPMMPQLSHPKVLATHLTAMSHRLCGSWHLWVLMSMCIPSRLEQACLLSHRCTVQPQAHHLISLRTQPLIWIWGHPAISAQNFSTSRTGVFEFKDFVWLFCCCFQYN